MDCTTTEVLQERVRFLEQKNESLLLEIVHLNEKYTKISHDFEVKFVFQNLFIFRL